MYWPAFVPLVCTCLNAVPTTTVGVTSVDPRAHFHQNPMESAAAFAASPEVCSMVSSPLTSNRDWPVRELRVTAGPDFSPRPARQLGAHASVSPSSHQK